MRLLALLLLMTALTGCAPWFDNGGEGEFARDEYPDIPSLECVVVSYSDELERYKRLFLSDSRAFYDHYVEFVWMKFRTQQVLDVYAARDLIVYVVEGFLERVNMDPVVSGDLFNFPFDANNLIIEIDCDSFNLYMDSRAITRIHMEDGDVHYYASDALDPDTTWFHQRCEPYDKAFRFSKFKSYRPWVKVPPKQNFEFTSFDISAPNSGGGSSVYKEAPAQRPRLVRPKQAFSDTDSSNTTGSKVPGGSFPSSSMSSH